MRIEEALFEFLRRSPAVMALAGGDGRLRLYPEAAAAEARVYGTYELVSETDGATLQGAARQPTARIRLTWVSQDESAAAAVRALAEATRSATGGGDEELQEFGPGWFPPGAPERLWVKAASVEEVAGAGAEQQAGAPRRFAHAVALEIKLAYNAVTFTGP